MVSYHGTSPSIAADIVAGKIDVTLGGGELGQGFYTGQYYHEARNWAYQRHNRSASVTTLDTSDDKIVPLDVRFMERLPTLAIRRTIKFTGTTRTYRFGCDMVWAPIVGSERVTGDQYKWESIQSQDLLNSSDSHRSL